MWTFTQVEVATNRKKSKSITLQAMIGYTNQ